MRRGTRARRGGLRRVGDDPVRCVHGVVGRRRRVGGDRLRRIDADRWAADEDRDGNVASSAQTASSSTREGAGGARVALVAITYDRGGVSEVDVDHVVALGDAWQKGAQQWPAARREKFANDRLNLMSVDAGANRQKGDGDAATWLPPNTSFRCEYVARQIAVKTRYEAWVTRAEHDAMARVLSRCPDEELPKSGARRVPVVPTHREAATPSAPRRTPKPKPRRRRERATCSPIATPSERRGSRR